MEERTLSCRCGQVALALRAPARAVPVVCYCKDCRAYVHWLGEPERVLDANGGTTIDANLPGNVRIVRGAERLACVSLSPHGTLRWYASCCRSPVANMSRNPRFPFIGCPHSDGGTAARSGTAPDARRLHINTGGIAANLPRPGLRGQLIFIGFAARMAWARLAGAQRANPFFGADSEPLRAPQVLGKEERARCEAAALGAAPRPSPR
jgi:hypothetical protein